MKILGFVIGMICLIIIYLLISKTIFTYCAKRDIFNEIDCWLKGGFPSITFFVSLFWLVAIPVIAIVKLISWGIDEIVINYQAILSVEEHKKRQMKKNSK